MSDHTTVSEISSAKKFKPYSPTPNKTQTGNENVALLHPLSFSAEESVFSIDHLLESLLTDIDRKTLLNCRRVSRRWVHFSSKFLQKIITLKFQNTSNDQVLYCTANNQDRPIQDLVTLMKDSTDGNFPCTSFKFPNNYAGKIDSLAQCFFSAHGHFVKKMEFVFDLLVSDLRRLLITQAPNLEELICSLTTWRYTESECRLNQLETEEDGRRRRESLFSTIIGPKPVFKSLKKFMCMSEGIPTLFFQQLLECSPNLVEVFLWPECLPSLVQPVNHLHLLKRLAVEVKAHSIDALAVLANNHGGHWAVENIDLGTSYKDWGPAMMAQAKEVVGKILEGCAPTCQKLQWDDGLEDFQFPVMSGVKHFRLHYYKIVPTEEIISNFPEIERLGDTFPNLRSLEVKTGLNVYLTNENVFGNNVPAPVPVPSVRIVSFKFHRVGPDPRLLESFREMFPNAVIITETVFTR